MQFLLLLIIVVALAAFWVYQFVVLMLLQDSLLPGRHDKVLWFAAFLLCPLLTPFAFLIWSAVRKGGGDRGAVRP